MTTSDSNSANEPQLCETYARMSDEELKSVAAEAGNLTDLAQALMADEMRRRSLAVPAALPIESHQVEYQPWVTISGFRDVTDAALAKGCLESAGIECRLADEYMLGVQPLPSIAQGSARIQVKPEDEDAAREILKQPIPESFDAGG